jgi:hypothetical protein
MNRAAITDAACFETRMRPASAEIVIGWPDVSIDLAVNRYDCAAAESSFASCSCLCATRLIVTFLLRWRASNRRVNGA